MASKAISDVLAQGAEQLANARPLLPMYIHLLLSALFPIYTGAHASLSRPSSAAKPSEDEKRRAKENGDEEETVQKMEGLSPQDAIIFPITAGLVLGGLYMLIKYYGAEVINFILGWYFSGVGVFSVAKMINDGLGLVSQLVFPRYYWRNKTLWKAMEKEQKMVAAYRDGTTNVAPPQTPVPALPWLHGRGAQQAWKVRSMVKQKFLLDAFIRSLVEIRADMTLINLFATFISLALIAYSNLVACPWWLTNIQGFAVSYSALQFMSPTSFTTGSLILVGLFFYDIWAVFFTPLMVSVAQNLEQPIKLVFPRPDEPGAEGEPPIKNFSMLGLGDIVLPGIVIGLALRFDLYMFYLKKQQKTSNAAKTAQLRSDSSETKKAEYIPVSSRWGDRLWTLTASEPLPEIAPAVFSKPYFTASIVGYVIGMLTTLLVMSVFQHAQPALLYLVPGVLISLWTTALARGEIKDMWAFSEGLDQSEVDLEEKKGSEEAQPEASDFGLLRRLWTSLYEGEKAEKEPSKEPESVKGEESGKDKLTTHKEEQAPEKVDSVDERAGIWIHFSIKDLSV